MKWCLAVLAASSIGFAGLFAVIDGRGSAEGAGGPLPGGSSSSALDGGDAGDEPAAQVPPAPPVSPVSPVSPKPDVSAGEAAEAAVVPDESSELLEARLEREVIEPLRARREWAEGALFSRAGPSRGRIGFDFSRVEVPERLRPVAAAAIALEIAGERRLLPVRSAANDRPLEIRVGETWLPAREWIEDQRSDLTLAELCAEPLPRIARSGASFEAAVAAKLIGPLEERRKEALRGALSRVAMSTTIPFELARLETTPEPWAGRADGAIQIDSWAREEHLVVPFRMETEGGELEVNAGGRWMAARTWLARVGADLGEEALLDRRQ